MKIRMTMMLLTMSYFGLPSLNGQEIRLRSYNRETSSDYGCVVPGGQYLTWVRANNHAEDWLWVDPWDNGAMYYGMWDDACHNGLTHSNSGERFQIWPCCQNLLTGDGHEQGWQWNTDVYSEWDREILPFGYHWQVPWEHCVYTNITVSEPHNPSGIVTTNIYRYDGRTRIELLTGGPTNSTREALFLLSVSAAAGNNAIPPAQLSALGKPAMPEGGTNPVYGVIYKKLQDNQIVDATVSAPGDCYTFSASAYKSYLVLEDAAIGDVTDKTNVVWVGERIALTCSLDNWIAEITNFSWTVPGIRIGNWRVGNVVHSDNTVTPNG